jgi:predicted N-acyltransferase
MFLVMAHQNNEPIACALYFKDEKNLYGRYWGCAKEIDGLHFEVCYYQGIEYCIENNIQHFDPGTQGEHKISRGFEPIFRYSLHYLQHEGFHAAVGDFVKEERKSLELYQKNCYEHLPFNQEHLPPLKN